MIAFVDNLNLGEGSQPARFMRGVAILGSLSFRTSRKDVDELGRQQQTLP